MRGRGAYDPLRWCAADGSGDETPPGNSPIAPCGDGWGDEECTARASMASIIYRGTVENKSVQ